MSLSLIPRMEKMKKQKMMTTNTIKKNGKDKKFERL